MKKNGRSTVIVMMILALVVVTAVGMFSLGGKDAVSPTRSIENVGESIEANLDAAGTLHVKDTRTYKFTGSYSMVGDALKPPEYGTTTVQGVALVDAQGNRTPLQSVEFLDDWRTEGGPIIECYSWDSEESTLYIFSPSQDQEKTFELDYSYTNATKLYSDVADLYWQFIPKGRSIPAENITCTLTLPVPEGETVRPADNVYAWEHCKFEGSVAFNDDGTITFYAPKTEPGTYAEARVALPASWLPQADMSHAVTFPYLDGIVRDEGYTAQHSQEEKDDAANTISDIRAALLLMKVFSVVVVGVCVLLWLRFGRNHKPTFTETYWRDVPARGVDPAVVGRIRRWNERDSADISTMMMQLSQKGIIKMDACKGGSKRKPNYCLTLVKTSSLEMTEFEGATVDLLFGQMGNGSNTVTLEEIRDRGKRESHVVARYVDGWQAQLDRIMRNGGWVELAGKNIRVGMYIFASIMCYAYMAAVFGTTLISTTYGMTAEAFWGSALGLVPSIIAPFIFGNLMPRRSQEGTDIMAKCKALKKWFDDFTKLDEAIPTDSKVWGELLVYASMLGVSEKVLQQLHVNVPQAFVGGDSDSNFDFGNTSDSSTSNLSSFGNTIAFNAFGNALGTAAALAHQSSGGGSDDSGSDGGGGSSSDGGGGGFGSDGGDFAR